MYSEKPISDYKNCMKKLNDGNASHQKCTKKGQVQTSRDLKNFWLTCRPYFSLWRSCRVKNELKKGAEERTCHFSHRHCSKPIYRFDIRLESEPKNPMPDLFYFPEKKLDFTIDSLDSNGTEYIYISVPLVAFKELPDYIKGNANYQFER